MPRLSVWYIRSAFIYLILGFTFGALILFNKGIPLHPLVWRLLPAHIEFVLFGWTVLLVLGMAFWILPRFSSPPVRGNEKPVWAAFVLVNAGILLGVLASIFPAYGWLNLASRSAEAAGILAFALHALPRIKGV